MASILFLLCGITANIHPAVAVPGASCHRGCLIQYNGFDPCRPTIVITHGFNPLVRRIRYSHAEYFSAAIRRRCGDRFNLMGWDWNAAAFDYLSGRRNTNMAIWQGELLARRLRALGVRPGSTWLIGHSLGAVVMARAACDLSNVTGRRVAQLTLLDPVCVHHRMIFRWFQVTKNTCHVEHYWVGGRSGVGRHTFRRDVYTERVRGRCPFASWLAPRGNHAYLIEWYYESICHGCASGFPRGLRCFNRNCR
jgi:pimeloyl-ACP methyl ester carboxylesterase